MNAEILAIIEQLAREKGIERSILVDALKTALEAAARKRLPNAENLQCRFNDETGDIEVLTEKTVVRTVGDLENEIDKKSASKIVPGIKAGETVWVPHPLEDYGRIAAQLAKQVITQKVREAEIEKIYNDFIEKKGELVNGIVQRMERGDIFVDLGKAEGILPRKEQVYRETFNRGERIRAYVVEIKKSTKNALVILSRTHAGLIRRLFELEVPEISENMVEIMGIVREPHGRTKIAVKSNDRDIDAVGACVGMRGMRVQSIVQELRGEKIDIVEHSEDAEEFARRALSPAKISRVIMDHKEQQMTIIVADDQMSLAIGKKGQNVKLAAKLVNWKIDIKGESETRALLELTSPLRKTIPGEKAFFEAIGACEELDDTVAPALLENKVKTFDHILEKGVEGLCEFPGFESELAEKLVSMAEEYKPTTDLEKEVSDKAEDLEEETSSNTKSEDKQNDGKEVLRSQEDTEESKSALTETENEEEDEKEYPVQSLDGIDPEILETLSESGFQTLAELSVTPLEELAAIEGLSPELAKKILEQAKQATEKV
tara:strand:+ start:63 stop:1700 length:1638 start_codon:yes stop_codon:yes gene_type:complete